MRKKNLLIILLLIFAVLQLGLGTGASASTDATKVNVLSVVGQAKINIIPDMAAITIMVSTDAKTASGTHMENSLKMARAVSALKNLGIKEQDIRTVSYSLTPKFDYVSKGAQAKQVYISGYKAGVQVQVIIRDINSIGDALDAVIRSGASVSGGIVLKMSEEKMEKAYNEALTVAYKNATGKADVLAKNLGITLGKPKQIDESSTSSPGYTNETLKSGDAASASPSLLDVSVRVALRYEY